MNVNLLPNPFARTALKLTDALLQRVTLHKKFDVIPPSKKLLLCNGGHLGDVVLMTALLKPLKEAFADLKIGIVVGSWSKCAVEDHPLIDWIHVFDHWKTNRGEKRLQRHVETHFSALSEIKKVGYDTSVACPFHFPNFAPLLALSKIPVRIGFDSAGFSPLLTHPQKWSSKPQNAAEYFFDLLKPLGLEKIAPLKPNLSSSKRRIAAPYVVMHMSSGNERIEWEEEKWLELGKRLSTLSYRLVFTGRGLGEFKKIERVRSQLPFSQNCSNIPWQEFVSLIEHAKLVISVETSAGHIAAAFDTPSVLLYTGINPLERWSPLSSKSDVVTHPVPCSPCYKGCKEMSCIKKLELDSVWKHILARM